MHVSKKSPSLKYTLKLTTWLKNVQCVQGVSNELHLEHVRFIIEVSMPLS